MARRKQFAVMAAVMLLTVACGGEEAGSGGGPEPLKIGATVTTFGMGLAVNVNNTDAGKEHGFDVEMVDFGGQNANTIAALLGGDIDVAIVATGGALDPIREGVPLRVVASTSTAQGVIGLRKNVADRIAQQGGPTLDSPVEERIEALRGLKIGVSPPPSATYTVLSAILQAGGLDPDEDVEITNTPDVPVMLDSVQSGRIDGGQRGGGVFAPMIKDGKAVAWVSATEVPSLSKATYNIALIREDQADDEEWVQRVHDVFATSYQLAVDDLDGFLGRLPKDDPNFEGMDSDLLKIIWDEVRPSLELKGKVPQDAWEASKELQNQVTGEDYGDLSYEDYVLPAAR